MTARRFARLTWSVLGFNLLVILWGAYVRASGSGAGCGSHWPLCNGVVIPVSPGTKTLVEFAHRVTSGLSLVLASIVFLSSRRTFPAGHPARRSALAVLGFTLSEALIGAAIVLMGWVAANPSMIRAVSVSLHFVNTLFLVAALTWTAWQAAEPASAKPREFSTRGLAALFLVVGASGAVTALGDTLFPATSLLSGIRSDLDAHAPRLLSLRVYHPLFAVAFVVFILIAVDRATSLSAGEGRDPRATRAANLLRALVLGQLALGFLNLVLLAPIAIQMAHLALAQAIWISLVSLAYFRHENVDQSRSVKSASISVPAAKLADS